MMHGATWLNDAYGGRWVADEDLADFGGVTYEVLPSCRSGARRLYSERQAMAAMGPVRRAAHELIRGVYHGLPERLVMHPRAGLIRAAWRRYRRSWAVPHG